MVDISALANDPATWVAVSTAVFALVAFKPLKNALLGQLDKRAIKISDELEEAAKLKAEAEQLVQSYQKKYEEAVKESEEIITTARKEAATLLENAKKEMDISVKKRMEVVMQRIAQAEKSALNDIQINAVDIAMNAARHIVKEKIDQGMADDLINVAISDLQKKLH